MSQKKQKKFASRGSMEGRKSSLSEILTENVSSGFQLKILH